MNLPLFDVVTESVTALKGNSGYQGPQMDSFNGINQVVVETILNPGNNEKEILNIRLVSQTKGLSGKRSEIYPETSSTERN